MKVMRKNKVTKSPTKSIPTNDSYSLEAAIEGSWSKITPFWPLKNLIAVNPIAGFEDLLFEEGLKEAKAYFQQKDIPQGMQDVNRESIKWLQPFFDAGQATIPMPHRHLGFLKCILSLIKFDVQIHKNDPKKLNWLKKLPQKTEKIIYETLLYLGIPTKAHEQFLTLMLTTLPGWAAYIQYCTNWADSDDAVNSYSITKIDYLAFRLVITCLVWSEAKDLIVWHQDALSNANIEETYNEIATAETAYQAGLLKQLDKIKLLEKTVRPKAQLVFCIDVRSEPFRRAIEMQGDYETYGFAGFFGVPVAIKNAVTGECYASCPVLLKPAHTIIERPIKSHQSFKERYRRLLDIKKLYQSVKYTFATPFSLVEAIGICKGIWMGLRSLLPNTAAKIQQSLKSTIVMKYDLIPDVTSISFEQQVMYGASVLKIMGLTENFAPIVIFCGHGSTTQNNAYATALDCGACGGHHGAPNARILATILNAKNVRRELVNRSINIPEDTLFVAAEHNTTTDEVDIYLTDVDQEKHKQINEVKKDLKKSRDKNSLYRANQMGVKNYNNQAHRITAKMAQDWAEVRPEWGLARNAAFIIGPRALTKEINLEGRTFLHSYDWKKDRDASSLTTIMTAPMVVAQWINAQYLFSTLDNIAFGGGSKITNNITGKIAVMQGNASDIMHGLPLQSVFKTDSQAYHQLMRLTVIVYAPKIYIDPIIEKHGILKKLFGNEWVHLICIDSIENKKFNLQRDLTWSMLT